MEESTMFQKPTALALLLAGLLASQHAVVAQTAAPVARSISAPQVFYRTVGVDGVTVFYRDAGPEDAPVVLLLHGFPTSSHMYRDLIPLLADRYRVIAPDLPGFGFTLVPASTKYRYTFDNLGWTIGQFTERLGLDRYAIYVFDYGAPVGYRLALAKPERVTALISQNGNAYEEGLSAEGWDPVRRYWRDPTPANRQALRKLLSPEFTRFQYFEGVKNPALIAPESYALDDALLARPGNDEIQLDLFLDYESNVARYPEFQKYFRTHRPPLLAVWGRNDPFFLPAGALAYQRDNPQAEVHLLDTGHFALETHAGEIAAIIRDFLVRKVSAGKRQPDDAAGMVDRDVVVDAP
jgi:pimeloyl-ACP methyl ester carboxylesterase